MSAEMPEPHASNLERVKVDTALPFESVKAAVSLFGGQINAKKSSFLEKRAAQDAELLHAQEELLRLKELLEVADREKEKALQDLSEAKEALDQVNEGFMQSTPTKSTAKEGFGSDLHSVRACRQGLTDSENKYSLWQLKLKCANEKHIMALSEIESAKQQLTDLKQELLASSSENDAVLKQTEEELLAMDDSIKGAEYLSTEHAGVNNWLSILKHASCDAYSKERAGAKSSVKGSIGEVHAGSEGLDNELELKLLLMMNGSIRAREELKSAKDEESRALSIACELLATVDAIRSEPKKDRSFSRMSLLAVLEALKIQAENLQKDVADLRESEGEAAAKSGILSSELEDVKAELDSSRADANERLAQLSLALRQTEAEVAKGKAHIDSLQEEVSMTRSRTASVEAKAIVSVSKLSQALKQCEADLAEARNEIAALKDQASETATSIESLAQISQALKQAETEIEILKGDKQALQEELSQVHSRNAAEDAKAKECIEQLTQALKQVEAELETANGEKKASQKDFGFWQDISQQGAATTATSVNSCLSSCLSQAFDGRKSATLVQAGEVQRRNPEEDRVELDEVESMRSSLKQALHRAEMAEVRKSSAEVELRRLREREQRRREKAMAVMGQHGLAKNPFMGNEQPSALLPAKPHCEPLGNVLNINISAERTKTLVQIGSRRLKKTSTSNFTGVFSASSRKA